MDYLAKAIRKLRPTAEFSYNNDDYSTVKWDFIEGDIPTEAEINAVIQEIKTEEAQAQAEAEAKRQALLDKLGITADEAKLLLG